MPRTLPQAVGFLLGFWLALWLSPLAVQARPAPCAEPEERTLRPAGGECAEREPAPARPDLGRPR